jgi:hypothetical protein
MKVWFASAVALSLSACAGRADEPSANITRVISTTSFGMCVGYCTTRLELSEGQAVLIRQARGGRGGAPGPDQLFSAPLTPSEWRDIQRLASNVDLEALPDVVGCPDCADGGAEGLILVAPTGSEEVSFEFGAQLAPAQPLLDRVRALRARLTPDEGR